VPLLEGPKPTEVRGSDKDESHSLATIDDKIVSSAIDLGHFTLPPDSALKIVPLLNQDDASMKNSIKSTLSTITKQNDAVDSSTIPSSTDKNINSDVHSDADSHSSGNSHSDVNPFRRYMSPQLMSSINRNEQVYIDTRDTGSFWLVSIVTIILSGVVAFIVTKAANRNGVVQVLTVLVCMYVCIYNL